MDKIEILRDLLGRSSTVIFDFDNVIVDSEPYHYEAYARVFAKRGHVINRDEYWLEWTSRGGGAESEIRRYNLDLDPAEIRAEKDPIYSGLCASGAIRPFPAAASVITRLHRRDLSLAIASGSYESDIRTILASCGLDRYFEAIVGKDNVERWKPHPETYLAAAATGGYARPFEDGDVRIEGHGIIWEDTIRNNVGSWNGLSDVTAYVESTINAAPPGTVLIDISESHSDLVDGVILAVVFETPTVSPENAAATVGNGTVETRSGDVILARVTVGGGRDAHHTCPA